MRFRSSRFVDGFRLRKKFSTRKSAVQICLPLETILTVICSKTRCIKSLSESTFIQRPKCASHLGLLCDNLIRFRLNIYRKKSAVDNRDNLGKFCRHAILKPHETRLQHPGVGFNTKHPCDVLGPVSISRLCFQLHGLSWLKYRNVSADKTSLYWNVPNVLQKKNMVAAKNHTRATCKALRRPNGSEMNHKMMSTKLVFLSRFFWGTSFIWRKSQSTTPV